MLGKVIIDEHIYANSDASPIDYVQLRLRSENDANAKAFQSAFTARAAQERLRQRTTASRQQFDSFVSKTGIEVWPSIDDLKTNPFVYKGKIVGLWISFDKMAAG